MERLKKIHPDAEIKVHDPPSDGNCLFSAASLAIAETTGQSHDQTTIRAATCQILNNEFSVEIQSTWLGERITVSGAE